ncbi:MAG: hypothetical protein ABR606_06095 [Vicinamibacterales bacterium]
MTPTGDAVPPTLPTASMVGRYGFGMFDGVPIEDRLNGVEQLL